MQVRSVTKFLWEYTDQKLTFLLGYVEYMKGTEWWYDFVSSTSNIGATGSSKTLVRHNPPLNSSDCISKNLEFRVFRSANLSSF
jgi:hypothetical protein